MIYNEHPFGGEPLAGRRMTLGEKITRTCFYASTNGDWMSPGLSVGATIESAKVVWVEPVPLLDPKQKLIVHRAAVTAK